ncbi:glycosyltransferase family 2 protein [Mucilaginibacter aquatilis]
MATYNGNKFISIQLDSILSQINQSDEIIISDDGSTDGTLDTINNFKDERIKVINNVGKKGPVGNFENALKHCSGEIIFLADQDDRWLPGKYQKHINGHEDYDLVISDATVVDENHQIIFSSFFKQRKSKKGLLNNLLTNSYIGCCMSFKRDILNASLPFPHSIHMHDWWIGLIAELKGKVFFLNEPLMLYVRHSVNASGTLVKRLPLKDQLINRFDLIRNLIKFKISNGTKQ